jgi:hypothetical protein
MNNPRPNAFGSTFAFFANAQTNAKKCKRATKPTHNDTTTIKRNEEREKGLQLTGVWQNGGISAKLSFCTSINISANLNICTSNPPLRQAPKRCASA